MFKPKCDKPLLLINKYMYSLIYSGGLLHVLDKPVHIDKHQLNQFPFMHLLQDAKYYTDSQLDSCFVLFNGRKEPFFVYVPCGKCVFCRHAKQVDIINRSILETLQYDCPPFFFTLTYNNANLPRNGSKVSYELRYKDVQDFFKRLRHRWDKKKLKHNVRYLVAGEYGHRFHRPHYHVILWNNPYNCNELMPVAAELREDIFLSWRKCDTVGFQFGQCKGGAAPYATKYVTKDCDMTGHYIKPFIHCSNGHGGLGSRYIDSQKDLLRLQPSQNYLEYLDSSGSYQYMFFSKYLQQRLWPSPSRCVPSQYRSLYKQLCELVSLGSALGLQTGGYELCDSVLSLKGVMRNQFIVQKSEHRLIGLCRIYYLKRYERVLSVLLDELSVVPDFDYSYIEKYQQHQDCYLPVNYDELAMQRLKYMQQSEVLLDKSTF